MFYVEMCWRITRARWVIPVLGLAITVEFVLKLADVSFLLVACDYSLCRLTFCCYLTQNIRIFTVPRVGGVLKMLDPKIQLASIIASLRACIRRSCRPVSTR